jgi:hypothetical protein
LGLLLDLLGVTLAVGPEALVEALDAEPIAIDRVLGMEARAAIDPENGAVDRILGVLDLLQVSAIGTGNLVPHDCSYLANELVIT